jgi:hypothetical protein
LNSKLHAVTDQDGKPLILLLTPGQMSDHKGAKLMLPQAPPAQSLTGDKGYVARRRFALAVGSDAMGNASDRSASTIADELRAHISRVCLLRCCGPDLALTLSRSLFRTDVRNLCIAPRVLHDVLLPRDSRFGSKLTVLGVPPGSHIRIERASVGRFRC